MKNNFRNFKFQFVAVSAILLGGCETAQDNAQHHSSVKEEVQTPELMLTDSQIKLANITMQPVRMQDIGQTVPINARLMVDEQKSEVVSSRAGGRIEKLFIKETGHQIHKGQPLYVLYSETLLTLQREYLLAKEQYDELGESQKRYKSFLEAAERKLLLYGLTPSQISKITAQAALEPRITFLAPTAGIVTEINATEGQYVAEGSTLFRIEDMSTLWVEAELYPGESSLVKPGDKVNILVSGTDTQPVEGTVTFLSPEFRNNSQITVMRASLDNPGNRVKPGQHAQVFLTHSAREAIAIPSDAVIRDEHGSHVYVQSGRNTFKPQFVTTGIESVGLTEIMEGLQQRDTIAVTGAYLLYSELILKKGIAPTGGHRH